MFVHIKFVGDVRVLLQKLLSVFRNANLVYERVGLHFIGNQHSLAENVITNNFGTNDACDDLS